MIVNMGVMGAAGSSGTPTPVYSPLTQKLIDLGAIEVWPMDDVSGGAKAVVNSDHNLLETDGTNVAYGYEFESLVGVYGVDLTDNSGDKTYLRSVGDVSALQLTGDLSVTFVKNASVLSTWTYPEIGMIGESSGTAASNTLYSVTTAAGPGSPKRAVYGYQHSANTLVRSSFSDNLLINISRDLFTTITKNSVTKKIRYYLNGEFRSENSYTDEATGGTEADFVVGRGMTRLGVSERSLARFGTVAVNNTVLSDSDVLSIYLTAINLDERFPLNSVTKSNNRYSLGAFSSKANEIYPCYLSSPTTYNLYYAIGLTSISDTFYMIQMSAGTISFSHTGGTIVNNLSTVNIGDIVEVKRTGATEFTLAISSK